MKKPSQSLEQSSKKLKIFMQSKQIQNFLQEMTLLRKSNADLNALSKISRISLQQTEEEMKKLIQKCDNEIKLTESKGWKTTKINQTTSISIKIEKQTIYSTYSTQITPSIVQNLCIMLYHPKFYNYFIPFCQKSMQLAHITPMEKIAFLKLKIPVLSDRCLFLHGIGVDRIDQNDTVMIFCQGMSSLKNKERLRKLNINYEKLSKNKVEINLKSFTLEIRKISPQKYALCSTSKINMHNSMLPEWLINRLISQVGTQIVQKFIKQAGNLKGTVWEKEIKEKSEENKAFYKWLHQRVEYWQKKESWLGKAKL